MQACTSSASLLPELPESPPQMEHKVPPTSPAVNPATAALGSAATATRPLDQSSASVSRAAAARALEVRAAMLPLRSRTAERGAGAQRLPPPSDRQGAAVLPQISLSRSATSVTAAAPQTPTPSAETRNSLRRAHVMPRCRVCKYDTDDYMQLLSHLAVHPSPLLL